MKKINGMRIPTQVFEAIYDVIPEEIWNKLGKEKRKLFNWYIEDASYKAPEQWPEVYIRFQSFLFELTGREWGKDIDNNLWIVKVWSIFSTLSEEEIIRDIKGTQQ